MPCWNVIESKVEFLEANTDVGLLKLALEAMGFVVTQTKQGLSFIHRYGGTTGEYVKATGQLTQRGSQAADINEVKRGYSKQVVELGARKQGWKISWSKNAEGLDEATVVRRS